MQATLTILGAVALLFTAGYHLTGLRQVSAGLEGERLGLTRAAWIGIAVDWILVASHGLRSWPTRFRRSC